MGQDCAGYFVGVCEVWAVSTTGVFERDSSPSLLSAGIWHAQSPVCISETKFRLNLGFTWPLMWSLVWLNDGKTDSLSLLALSPKSAKPEEDGCVVCVLVPSFLCVGETLGLPSEAGKLGLWVWRVGLGDRGKETKSLWVCRVWGLFWRTLLFPLRGYTHSYPESRVTIKVLLACGGVQTALYMGYKHAWPS